MAEDEAQVQEKVASTPSLKYLGFVPIAYFKLTLSIFALYDYAKSSSGPLMPGVQSVEDTVKTVVGPVYQKIEGKPYELLVFADGKLDTLVQFLDGALPQKVKDTGSQAYGAARSTVSEVQSQGIYTTAKSYYVKYEPVAESYGVQAYKKALTFPLVPEVVSIIRSGALKCNDIIASYKQKGFPLACYLPLVPVSYFDKITQTE